MESAAKHEYSQVPLTPVSRSQASWHQTNHMDRCIAICRGYATAMAEDLEREQFAEIRQSAKVLHTLSGSYGLKHIAELAERIDLAASVPDAKRVALLHEWLISLLIDARYAQAT